MHWIENRLSSLEQRFESWVRQLQDLIPQLRAAAQNARNAYQQYTPTGAQSGAVYFCLPTTLTGATGSWPSLTPTSQSLTVYQASGTSLTSLGTFTVYNWYPAAPAASKVCQVAPDGSGNFVVVAQSCS
jgi:hypothetical protein